MMRRSPVVVSWALGLGLRWRCGTFASLLVEDLRRYPPGVSTGVWRRGSVGRSSDWPMWHPHGP